MTVAPWAAPIWTSPDPVEAAIVASARPTWTSPDPLLTRRSAAAESTLMSPEPVSTVVGAVNVSRSTLPDPLLNRPPLTAPVTEMSALPVLIVRSLPVGTVTVTSSRLSPPRKPPRWRGATTVIWSPVWTTETWSASRPATSTRDSVVSVAVTATEPLPISV